MQNRWLTFLLFLAAALQTGLIAAGLPAWTCPFKTVFSIPCPACGMTTGMVYLLHGQWASALQAHLFSPLLLAGTALAGLAVLLPAPLHRRFINRVEAFERSTAVSMWVGACLGVIWIWRLAEVI